MAVDAVEYARADSKKLLPLEQQQARKGRRRPSSSRVEPLLDLARERFRARVRHACVLCARVVSRLDRRPCVLCARHLRSTACAAVRLLALPCRFFRTTTPARRPWLRARVGARAALRRCVARQAGYAMFGMSKCPGRFHVKIGTPRTMPRWATASRRIYLTVAAQSPVRLVTWFYSKSSKCGFFCGICYACCDAR